MIIAILVAGLFLCNCVPHLASGLMGRVFPTPFAKPRGVGLSSPLANSLWGFANLFVGLLLLQYWPVGWMFGPSFQCFLLGVLLMGVYLSIHFGRVMQAKP